MPVMENALYVVATPIGNLGDISLRALETLRGVDLVACEDTRHARHLLDHHGIKVPTLALHQHNENEAADKLIRLLGEGRCIALVSDAGTPGVSDPGARTVAAVRAAGFRVIPLPGPNAAIAALSAAGMTDPRFLFVGFLPAKPGAPSHSIREGVYFDGDASARSSFSPRSRKGACARRRRSLSASTSARVSVADVSECDQWSSTASIATPTSSR